MSEFDILSSAAAGMEAERSALELAARNVAAAEATPDGHPFERLVPRFALGPAAEPAGESLGIPTDGQIGARIEAVGGNGDPGEQPEPAIRYIGSRVQRGVAVDAVTEMVSVLDAQRAYEASASVFDLGKRLAERTIDMGRLS